MFLNQPISYMKKIFSRLEKSILNCLATKQKYPVAMFTHFPAELNSVVA